MRDADSDIDRLLEAANPLPGSEVGPPAQSRIAQTVYFEVTKSPYKRRVRRPRSTWLWRIGASVVALAGVGTGAAALASSSNHVTQRLSVLCYDGSNEATKVVRVAAISGGPVAACSQAWSAGHVGAGLVPLLVGCITPQGVAAVFVSAPGADVCGQLGLPPLPAAGPGPTTLPAATTLPAGSMPASLYDAIVTQLRSECLSESQATQALKALLTNAGLHWSVVVPEPFPAGRPCASPGFDEIDHRILLTGVPQAQPPST